MGEQLRELENNEAILLMYIAGELPEEERREVETMLSRSEAMRRLHDELRQAWRSVDSGVEAMDRSDVLSVASREAAARLVGRSVRQWHARRAAERAAVRPARPAARRWPYPWWQTSGVAAAALLVGFLVWWGFVGEPVTGLTGSQVAGHGGSGRFVEPEPVVANPGEDAMSDLLVVSAVDVTGLAASSLSELEMAASHLEYLGGR
jgi:anti-sigma factor RsiW